MQSIFGQVGVKDTDFEILKHVDDRNIKNLCLLNRYSNKTINSDSFWIQRVFQKYGKYLENTRLIDYKGDRTWKEYYIEIKQYVENDFPYYYSALSLAAQRYDLFLLIGKMRQAIVRQVNLSNEETNSVYYTRNGQEEGMKEGYEYVFNKGSTEERIHKSGRLLQETISTGNKKVRKIYDRNEIHIYKWKNDGPLLHKEIFNTTLKKRMVEKWFVNGKPRSKGDYVRNKKQGTWETYDKNGNKSSIFYHEGKKIISRSRK